LFLFCLCSFAFFLTFFSLSFYLFSFSIFHYLRFLSLSFYLFSFSIFHYLHFSLGLSIFSLSPSFITFRFSHSELATMAQGGPQSFSKSFFFEKKEKSIEVGVW
jgi:hypothetical protein